MNIKNYNNSDAQKVSLEQIINNAFNGKYTFTVDATNKIVGIKTIEANDCYQWDFVSVDGKATTIKLPKNMVKEMPEFDTSGNPVAGKTVYYQVSKKDGFLRPITTGTITLDKSFNVVFYKVTPFEIKSNLIRKQVEDEKEAETYLI